MILDAFASYLPFTSLRLYAEELRQVNGRTDKTGTTHTYLDILVLVAGLPQRPTDGQVEGQRTDTGLDGQTNRQMTGTYECARGLIKLWPSRQPLFPSLLHYQDFLLRSSCLWLRRSLVGSLTCMLSLYIISVVVRFLNGCSPLHNAADMYLPVEFNGYVTVCSQ